MQIKLGEKIRELRKQNGRKQEDLAVALGVSNQAVSRWEANGGYPDMEMIPGIANYFHITIDELFGYDNDREVKLKSYIDQADQMLGEQSDMTPCVAFLRNAVSEFPSEWRLEYRLASALLIMGWQKYGARGRTTDGCDYTQQDIAYHSQNEYWKEGIALYEKVLKSDIDVDFRMATINSLMSYYSLMGDNETAEKMALSQPSIRVCKEVLLPKGSAGEKRERYQGEAILVLMEELKNVINDEIMTKLSLGSSQKGLDKLLAVIQLYESVLDDGNCGVFHSDLCSLYLRCSAMAARLKDFKGAMRYFDTSFDHFTKFNHFKEVESDHQFTAPLVSKAKGSGIMGDRASRDVFETYMKFYPAELADEIRNNPKYSPIFAE